MSYADIIINTEACTAVIETKVRATAETVCECVDLLEEAAVTIKEIGKPDRHGNQDITVEIPLGWLQSLADKHRTA